MPPLKCYSCEKSLGSSMSIYLVCLVITVFVSLLEHRLVDEHPYCDACADELDAVINIAEHDAQKIFGGVRSSQLESRPAQATPVSAPAPAPVQSGTNKAVPVAKAKPYRH